jgi:hypothetical protein
MARTNRLMGTRPMIVGEFGTLPNDRYKGIAYGLGKDPGMHRPRLGV